VLPIKLVFAILLACVSFAAASQPYPNRPIRMLIPFPAGSAADIIARALEPALRERLSQPIVIDNRGGAGGNICAELTAKSPPDGYTLMTNTIGTHAINMSLYSKVNFHPLKDFTHIILVGDSPNVLVLHPSVPVQTVSEFITLAKARPGILNYGSGGSGTTVHLSGELFNVMAGVKMVHVPYKGATEALTGLLSGQTDLQFASVSSAIPLIQAGRLKALAVTSLKRSPSLPDLPTVAEAALPGFDAVAWYGFVGPANLPANVVTTIYKSTLAALGQADVAKRLFNSGVEIRTLAPEEYVRFNVTEIDKWAKVVKASGARVN
jgi:tripartite-type tricarboxylate transporter receptor subunit TctC